MPLSDAERQKRYRERMGDQGVKRYQIMLPEPVVERVGVLTRVLNCTKGELLTRLIEQEYRSVTGVEPHDQPRI